MKVKCFITGEFLDEGLCVGGNEMRDTIFAFIRQTYPDFTVDDYISRSIFEKFRWDYLLDLLKREDDDLSQTEKEVVEAIASNKILSENIEPWIDKQLTLGQRTADMIASFGGSWKFIILFFLTLMAWIITNAWLLGKHPFDPYPFILLNLILSCLAAVQAPIIMMSQNRQEQKDRQRSENDFKVNLKAEIEIKLLHEKLDHLTHFQNKILFEIQQLQIEYLQDIMKQIKKE